MNGDSRENISIYQDFLDAEEMSERRSEQLDAKDYELHLKAEALRKATKSEVRSINMASRITAERDEALKLIAGVGELRQDNESRLNQPNEVMMKPREARKQLRPKDGRIGDKDAIIQSLRNQLDEANEKIKDSPEVCSLEVISESMEYWKSCCQKAEKRAARLGERLLMLVPDANAHS